MHKCKFKANRYGISQDEARDYPADAQYSSDVQSLPVAC